MPETSVNPNRIEFSSAGAVRRSRHTAAIPAVQLAHNALISALAQETPHVIFGYAADRHDILERRDHLKTVITYVKAIVADTADLAPLGYVDDETGYLEDAGSEIVGGLNRAVDKMLDDATDAAA